MSRLCYALLLLIWLVDKTYADGSGLSENKREHGPIITVQPENRTYDPMTMTTRVVMDCEADASPVATYVWYVEQAGDRRLVNLSDPKITVTNGILMLEQPSQTLHKGDYQCVASNRFGSVLSNEARINFAYLNDFPRSRRDPVIANQFTGIGIECMPPRNGYGEFELSYFWYKDTISNRVHSDIRWHTFVSNDSKLYFQFVTMDDEGDYYCVVIRPYKTMDNFGEGKISMPIPLRVNERDPSEQERELEMVYRFPKAFPSSPIAGDNVRVECLAWGASMSQMDYWWNRTDGKPIPSSANFSDYNRVMTIRNIQLSDAGRYRCSARRQSGNLTGNLTYGEVELSVEAAPYFTETLQDMNVEENSTVQWTCVANGVPAITYEWYVNSTLINDTLMMNENRERFQLVDNVLTITNVQPLDAGMYQCSAGNSHGTRFSSAQLRVIFCSPNCNVTVGCDTPNTCITCNVGYGRLPNGTGDVCGNYCNTSGCVMNGADKCDGCDPGYELTATNTCIPPLNYSSKTVMNWTLLLLMLLWHSCSVLTGLVIGSDQSLRDVENLKES